MRRRQRGLSFYHKRKKLSSNFLIELFTFFFGVFAAAFLAFVIVVAYGLHTNVIGNSMEPSLYNGQRVYIDRFVYKVSSPKRGDVIVFLPNGNENSHFYIKRIVALPGETVLVKDGKLYINGLLLEEGGNFDKMADGGIASSEVILGSEEYFVLGDNRNNSEDSRSANIGTVEKDYIIGKAWFHLGSAKAKMDFIKNHYNE